MTRESLIRAGVDYDGGVRRFAGKPQLYEKYLFKFFQADALAALQGQLAAGDDAAAFHAAHDLKGVTGNLSMGGLYDQMCELVECLRAGGQGGEALRLCERAMELYLEMQKAARE